MKPISGIQLTASQYVRVSRAIDHVTESRKMLVEKRNQLISELRQSVPAETHMTLINLGKVDVVVSRENLHPEIRRRVGA